MFLSRNRYQIFVPAVHDVDCKFISSEKLSIQFTSKDKSFLAEHSRGSNEYFCVNIKMAEDLIDKENIVVRGVRRKTFEVEVSYLRGMGEKMSQTITDRLFIKTVNLRKSESTLFCRFFFGIIEKNWPRQPVY